ncbi:MAG TPA: histidine kinase, partial [Jiangellaceae bacterium]|nr:histidine kinase [Jiangellaceae bacterium]
GVDWALAAVLVVLHMLAPQTGQSVETTAWQEELAVPLALGQGLPVAWRRRRPFAVATTVLACYAGYVVIVGLGPPFAAWVVIWSLATTGAERRRSIAAALVAAAATVVLVAVGELISAGSGASILLVSATVVVTLVAVLVRSERGRLEAVRQGAASEERLRIARDLHDLVGHGLSAVTVQSSAARMALDAGDSATARRALTAVESSSRAALREMRQLFGVLRTISDARTGDDTDAGADNAPTPGLADIARLVENVRLGGVAVTSETTGDVLDVPPAVQLCAYRVVQEALTNAVKHAPGGIVTVRVVGSAQTLDVAVETTGGMPLGGHVDSGGFGLEGIRTRVAAAGGQTRIGPTSEGWLVAAELPVQPEETRS